MGVAKGGLGIRRATDLALPAFIAAPVTTHPFPNYLGKSLDEVGLVPAGYFNLLGDELISAFVNLKDN